MTERVVAHDLGVRWDPNAPDARLSVDDYGRAELVLNAHHDDLDQRAVVLVWSGVTAAVFGPYNDEGLGHHRLHRRGLAGITWIGLVLDSAWREELTPGVGRVSAHHYICLTKEANIEVLADGLEVQRRSR